MFLLQAIWTPCFKLFKKNCNYCKKDGHIITKYPTRPLSFPNPTPIQQNVPTTIPTMTLEMVQQMIISAFSTLGFLVSCNLAIVDYQMWHKRLGHPNSNVLHDMLKSSFLGNKHISSLNVVHFDCILVSLEKVKFYCSQLIIRIRFTWVYFLHSKDEVFSTFKFFYAYFQT
ncbi:hypothetical protein CR513_38748, partial [Mucuna pruriens]